MFCGASTYVFYWKPADTRLNDRSHRVQIDDRIKESLLVKHGVQFGRVRCCLSASPHCMSWLFRRLYHAPLFAPRHNVHFFTQDKSTNAGLLWIELCSASSCHCLALNFCLATFKLRCRRATYHGVKPHSFRCTRTAAAMMLPAVIAASTR